MARGLIGQKSGMTRMFTEEGRSVPITVIKVEPNRVTQIKTESTDGYSAIQVAHGVRRANLINKPTIGHLAKAGVETGRRFLEFRLSESDVENVKLGDENRVDIFAIGQKVDVTGTTKGKGFAGVIKRYGFSRQDMTHGNSLSHRTPGSTGQNQFPGRVLKGKRMAGHLGNVSRTIQNLEIVNIDKESGLLFLKGAVPGARESCLIIKPAIKQKQKGNLSNGT
jgi:large subunit ribosomal protein L3